MTQAGCGAKQTCNIATPMDQHKRAQPKGIGRFLDNKKLQTTGVPQGDQTSTFLITDISCCVTGDHHHYLRLNSKKNIRNAKIKHCCATVRSDSVVLSPHFTIQHYCALEH